MRLRFTLFPQLVIMVAVLALSLVPRATQAAEPASAVWQIAERNGPDPTAVFTVRYYDTVQVTLSSIDNEKIATIGFTPIDGALPETLGAALTIDRSSTASGRSPPAFVMMHGIRAPLAGTSTNLDLREYALRVTPTRQNGGIVQNGRLNRIE